MSSGQKSKCIGGQISLVSFLEDVPVFKIRSRNGREFLCTVPVLNHFLAVAVHVRAELFDGFFRYGIADAGQLIPRDLCSFQFELLDLFRGSETRRSPNSDVCSAIPAF